MKLEQNSKRDFFVTVFLARYGFMFGLHRFYCGRILSGILYLIGWFFSGRRLISVVYRSCMATVLNYHVQSGFYSIYDLFNYFKDEDGFIFLFLTLIVLTFAIIDLVLIVCGKFRDSEGKVVCYSKIMDRKRRKKADS